MKICALTTVTSTNEAEPLTGAELDARHVRHCHSEITSVCGKLRSLLLPLAKRDYVTFG